MLLLPPGFIVLPIHLFGDLRLSLLGWLWTWGGITITARLGGIFSLTRQSLSYVLEDWREYLLLERATGIHGNYSITNLLSVITRIVVIEMSRHKLLYKCLLEVSTTGGASLDLNVTN